MSDIGVLSNVYQRIREYGQLIDEVLVDLRSPNSSPTHAGRKKLGELLSALASPVPRDLSAAWLAMLLGGADLPMRAEWARIGRALLTKDVDQAMISKLEELANRLEERRTDALGKMRGVRT